jgi:hypothetical protein
MNNDQNQRCSACQETQSSTCDCVDKQKEQASAPGLTIVTDPTQEEPPCSSNVASAGIDEDRENAERSQTAKSADPTEFETSMRAELEKLNDRLLNLEGGNPLVKLRRINTRTSFDLSILNEFGRELANEFLQRCLSADGSVPVFTANQESADLYGAVAKNLALLDRGMAEIKRENGTYDLFLGYPFLRGVPAGSKNQFQAPIFLIPAKLEKMIPPSGPVQWVVSFVENARPIINKSLFHALAKCRDIPVDARIFDEAISIDHCTGEKFLEAVHQLLLRYSIPCDLECPPGDFELKPLPELPTHGDQLDNIPEGLSIMRTAILGCFPQANASIRHDYEKIQELSPEEMRHVWPLLSDLYKGTFRSGRFTRRNGEAHYPSQWKKENDENFKPYRSIDERREQKNVFLLPSNPSQDKIMLELGNPNTRGIVIWGPPGTGKSQTIVNIIGDCLARDLNVLVVSQKRAALDVVYKRLESLGLSSQVALIHNSVEDRSALYKKIKTRTSHESEEDANVPEEMDPSTKCDELKDKIAKIHTALNDSSFGITFREIYKQLGGTHRKTVKIDSAWKDKKYSDLGPVR